MTETAGRFRKKPVEIEAVRFVDAPDADSLADWCGGRVIWTAKGTIRAIAIQTLEGEITASLGDWIIRGVKGEFYPCKPEIFALTYEPSPSPAVMGEK